MCSSNLIRVGMYFKFNFFFLPKKYVLSFIQGEDTFSEQGLAAMLREIFVIGAPSCGSSRKILQLLSEIATKPLLPLCDCDCFYK